MIKQIIEDLYLKPKFVENEPNEVLAFYLNKNENLEFVELMEEKLQQTTKNIKKLKQVKANVEYIQIYRKKSNKPLVIDKRKKLSCLEDFYE